MLPEIFLEAESCIFYYYISLRNHYVGDRRLADEGVTRLLLENLLLCKIK